MDLHSLYVEAAWRALVSFHRRSATTLAAARREVAKASALELISRGVEMVAGTSIPALGLVPQFLRWTAEKAIQRQKTRATISCATSFDVAEYEPDIVDDVVESLGRVCKEGFPLVVFVEDAHGGDSALLELLDSLLCLEGAVLVITTTWPGFSKLNPGLRELMDAHKRQGRLVQVGRSAPTCVAFPADAGFTELEFDARESILDGYFPRVEESTRRALLERYPNPLALELFCQLKKYQSYRVSGQELHLTEAEIGELPRELAKILREIWEGLPEEEKFALAVARIITPTFIAPTVAGGENRWDDAVLRKVIANIRRSEPHDMVVSELLHAPVDSTWVRMVDHSLRAFAEAPLEAIATTDGVEFANDCLRDAERTILKLLADALVARGDGLPHTTNSARSVLALHSRGHIDDDDLVVEVIDVLLTELSHSRRELSERVALSRKFTELKPQEVSPMTTFSIRSQSAVALYESGNYEGAIAEFTRLVADQQEELGPDHLDTLTTRRNLAFCLRASGAPQKAVSEFTELLADQYKELGSEHIDTLMTRSGLAVSRSDMGEVDTAISELVQLLIDEHEILMRHNLHVLATRNNLACCLRDSGRVEAAVAEFTKLLEDQQRILPPSHPDSLTTRNNLAYCLRQSGQVEAAVAEYTKLLEDQQEILDPEHPAILKTRNGLALSVSSFGEYEKAISDLTKLLEDQQRILPPDHLDTLITRNDLAYCLRESGQVEAAVAEFTGLLEDQQRILPPNHLEILNTRNNLAYCLRESGQVEAAVAEYTKLLEDQQEILDRAHPTIVAARSGLERCSRESS